MQLNQDSDGYQQPVAGWDGKSAAVLTLLAFVTVLLYLFREPLFSGLFLWAPDNAPLYPRNYAAHMRAAFTGQWAGGTLGVPQSVVPFHPFRALALIMPVRAYHLFSYPAGVVLLGIAAAYFLKGRGFNGLSVWLPALGFGFFGYFFTLVAAGHRGLFEGLPFAVLVFGCLDRAIVKSSWLHFAAAGISGAFALTQPDVAGLFLLLAALYGLFRIAETWRQGRRPRFWLRLGGGVLLGAACFLATASVSVSNFFGKQVGDRLEQIESIDADPWIFATNWSLPPEDTLEFLAPFVFGIDSGNPRAPYWGRLGQSHGWRAPGDGLMNLRQHTVYMGGLQLIFAAYGIVAVLRRRRHSRSPDNNGALTAAAPVREQERRETLFWLLTAITAWLLAMGRYTPVYRLVFMLPYGSLLRAPVKFLHLSGFALCFLFARGLSDFKQWAFSNPAPVKAVNPQAVKRRRKRDAGRRKSDPAADAESRRVFGLAGWLLPGLGAVLLISALLAPVLRDPLKERWDLLFQGMLPPARMPWLHELLMKRIQRSLVHSGLIFMAASGIFFLARLTRSRRFLRPLIPLALIVVLAVDLAVVGHPFVRVGDPDVFYSANPVAESLLAQPGHWRVSYLLPQGNRQSLNWPRRNLQRQGVHVLEPMPGGSPPRDYVDFFNALQRNPLRRYKLTSTKFVLGHKDTLQSLRNHAAFEPWMEFTIEQERFMLPTSGQAPFEVFHFKNPLPRAMVAYAWDVQPDDQKLLQNLTASDWNPQQSVWVSNAETAPQSASRRAKPADIIRYDSNRIVIEAVCDAEALLLLNDRYDPGWTVTVNGRRADLLRCNYLMRGVQLPPGEHKVVFNYRPYRTAFTVSMLPSILLAGWIVMVLPFRRRRRQAGSAS